MTPPLILIVFGAAPLAALILVAGIRLGRRYRLAQAARESESEPASPYPTRAPRTVLLPALRNLVHRRRPPVHVGATASWSPIQSVAGVGTAPELTTVPMQMAADHADLAALERRLVDPFVAAVDAVLDQLLRDDPRARMRLPSSVETTDVMDAAALRALFAADDARAGA